jgi:hypothetical protein
MTTFPIHTLSSAPEPSKPALQQLQDGFGFIPNVAGAIASSPVLMKAFVPERLMTDAAMQTAERIVTVWPQIREDLVMSTFPMAAQCGQRREP